MDTPGIVLLAFLVIVVPVVLGVGSDMIKRWMAHRERMAELTAQGDQPSSAHVERLEQRVRVLERIASDRGADLAMQIETLRDARELEKLP